MCETGAVRFEMGVVRVRTGRDRETGRTAQTHACRSGGADFLIGTREPPERIGTPGSWHDAPRGHAGREHAVLSFVAGPTGGSPIRRCDLPTRQKAELGYSQRAPRTWLSRFLWSPTAFETNCQHGDVYLGWSRADA